MKLCKVIVNSLKWTYLAGYENLYVINLKYIKKQILVTEIVGVNYMIVKRGDMFYADLSPVVGSEQRRN